MQHNDLRTNAQKKDKYVGCPSVKHIFITTSAKVIYKTDKEQIRLKPKYYSGRPYIHIPGKIGPYDGFARVLLKELMAVTFLEKPAEDYRIINIDNDPKNCRLDNLKYVSPETFNKFRKGRPSKDPNDDFAKIINQLYPPEDEINGKPLTELAFIVRKTEYTTRIIVKEMLEKDLISRVLSRDLSPKTKKRMEITWRPTYFYYLPEDETRASLLKRLGKDAIAQDDDPDTDKFSVRDYEDEEDSFKPLRKKTRK